MEESRRAPSREISGTNPGRDGLESAASAAMLVSKVELFVRNFMSQPQFDASHDHSHVLRVVALAKHILTVEVKANATVAYDPTVVTLAALMHDMWDRKYLSRIASPEASVDPDTPVESLLVQLGASPTQATHVQTIVKAVSFSHEIRDPAHVLVVLSQYPELAIVQDADRLDALGAVGIGRTFTYAGAKGGLVGGMDESIQHFEEKLLRLEGMMKTGEGRRLARVGTERLDVFRKWWIEEKNTAMLTQTNEGLCTSSP